jgi:glycosyltransferase involved in cell wall biosynthesis
MSRPIVLVPTDFGPWAANFQAGYAELGWDVVFGSATYEAESIEAHVVHINWPEELAGWQIPSTEKLKDIVAKLDRWAQRSKIILTVNNLQPHADSDHPHWRELYEACITRADLIHHFSQTSKDELIKLYPIAEGRNHFVRLGFRYERVTPDTNQLPKETRQSLGFGGDDKVFLVFGHMRKWAEMELLLKGFGQAKVPRKRLLFVARYPWRRSPKSLIQRLIFKLKMRLSGSVAIEAFIPDAELYQYFRAANAVVTVRKDGLTSGIPSLAMTLGAVVVAPALGSTPEFLAGTENPLYDPKDTRDLAKALEAAAHLDREAVGQQNIQATEAWKWRDILGDCLHALKLDRNQQSRDIVAP